ncbi:MAG: hypothetical protein HUJ72_01625, partial [Blautia sp.]|nr:hypothetical protein [Blautia sp.]
MKNKSLAVLLGITMLCTTLQPAAGYIYAAGSDTLESSGQDPWMDGQQPPQMPDGQTPGMDGQQPPQMPDGQAPGMDRQQPPQMPDGQAPGMDGQQP